MHENVGASCCKISTNLQGRIHTGGRNSHSIQCIRPEVSQKQPSYPIPLSKRNASSNPTRELKIRLDLCQNVAFGYERSINTNNLIFIHLFFCYNFIDIFYNFIFIIIFIIIITIIIYFIFPLLFFIVLHSTIPYT